MVCNVSCFEMYINIMENLGVFILLSIKKNFIALKLDDVAPCLV